VSTAAACLAAEPPKDPAPSAADSKEKSAAGSGTSSDKAASSAAAPAPGEPALNDPNMLRMNFRGASLDMVLNYLSEAAGFIINIKPGTTVRGKVDVWSSQPLTREEALNLVDTVLNQNGLAAIRNGKMLTIVNRDEAKTQNVRVIQGSDPKDIPVNDEVVTQIIPVRFVEVSQLLKDLQPLVSMQTTMTANDAGNAIVITDTQANVHKVAEIIKAIDTGAEEFTEVRVFRLTNSDPVEMQDLLSNLFPDDTRSGNAAAQSPFQNSGIFGRFASRFGGGFNPGGGQPGAATPASGGQNQRIKKRNRVITVADQRTASVIVSASRDLMDQIGDVITELDANPQGRQTVHVISTQNISDPQQVMTVLSDIFQRNNTTQNSRNSANQNSALQNRSSTQSQQQNGSTSRTGNTGSRSSTTSLPSFGQ